MLVEYTQKAPEQQRAVCYLRDAIGVLHHIHDIIQRQQGLALDLRGGVLAFSATGEQANQLYVVPGSRVLL